MGERAGRRMALQSWAVLKGRADSSRGSDGHILPELPAFSMCAALNAASAARELVRVVEVRTRMCMCGDIQLRGVRGKVGASGPLGTSESVKALSLERGAAALTTYVPHARSLCSLHRDLRSLKLSRGKKGNMKRNSPAESMEPNTSMEEYHGTIPFKGYSLPH